TVFRPAKRTELVVVSFTELDGPWSSLSGLVVRGYEIRHGETVATAGVGEALPGGRGFAVRSVLGVTVHGLFEAPAVVAGLFGGRPARSLDAVFDELADVAEERLDVSYLAALAEVA